MEGAASILYLWMDEFSPSCSIEKVCEINIMRVHPYSIHASPFGGMPAFLQLLCHAFQAVCSAKKQGLTADSFCTQRLRINLVRVQC